MTEPATPRRTLLSRTLLPRALSPRALSPRTRWAVPAVVAVAVTGAFLAPPLLASADDAGLPDVTPAQLVAAIADAGPAPLSGTVVYTARLGLPELPMSDVSGADPTALLGGSSTLRVWTDGTARSRVSLLGATSEYSVVHDGSEAWTYSSTDDAAVHYSLDAAGTARYDALAADAAAGTLPPVAGDLPTPAAAAQSALAQAEEFSTISLDASTTVAGRGAYQLVVIPKSSGTLVARVVIAVDAATHTPLRVQVWSTQDASTPALEIGFTDVRFAAPSDEVLAFSAPAGATVKDVVVPLPATPTTPDPVDPATAALPEGATVTGTGWESVAQLSGLDVAGLVAGDPTALATVPGAAPTIGSATAQDLIDQFVPRDGSGSPAAPGLDTSALYDQLTTVVPEGRLLTSRLLSVLVTNDGRVLVGAVPPETLRAKA